MAKVSFHAVLHVLLQVCKASFLPENYKIFGRLVDEGNVKSIHLCFSIPQQAPANQHDEHMRVQH